MRQGGGMLDGARSGFECYGCIGREEVGEQREGRAGEFCVCGGVCDNQLGRTRRVFVLIGFRGVGRGGWRLLFPARPWKVAWAPCDEGDCAMVSYNLNERAERPVIEYAAAHAKGILVKKALASGHACLGAGQDPVRASFELVFDQPGVAAAIVGTINPLHLAHNVAMAAQALKKA